MSRNNNNNTSVKPVQKFCKVCQDAGKSESEYLSHFTRETPDPNSKVVCPTLLALQCRFCSKNGHTVKYCPSLKEKEKTAKKAERTVSYINHSIKAEQKTKKGSNNSFLCLDCDSDEEQKVSKPQPKVVLKENFPQLCATSKCAPVVTTRNYASALAMPAAVPEAKVVPVVKAVEPKAVTFSDYMDTATVATASDSWATRKPKYASQMNWAAMEDDDDDDEEEDDDSW